MIMLHSAYPPVELYLISCLLRAIRCVGDLPRLGWIALHRIRLRHRQCGSAHLFAARREFRRRRGAGERTANRATIPRSVLVDLGIASHTTLATRVTPHLRI